MKLPVAHNPLRFSAIMIPSIFIVFILLAIGLENLRSIIGVAIIVVVCIFIIPGAVILAYREYIKFVGKYVYNMMSQNPLDRSKEMGEIWIQRKFFEITGPLFAQFLLQMAEWKGQDFLDSLLANFKSAKEASQPIDNEKLAEELKSFGEEMKQRLKQDPGMNKEDFVAKNRELLAHYGEVKKIIDSIFPLKDSKGNEIHAFMQEVEGELFNEVEIRKQIVMCYGENWLGNFAFSSMRGIDAYYLGNFMYGLDFLTTGSVSWIHTAKIRSQTIKSSTPFFGFLPFMSREETISQDVPFFVLTDSWKLRQTAMDQFKKGYWDRELNARTESVQALSAIAQIAAAAPLIDENIALKERTGELSKLIRGRLETILYVSLNITREGGFSWNWKYTAIAIAGITALTLLALFR